MSVTKTPHKWADVLRAIADGEEVQYFCNEKWFPMIHGHSGITPLTYPDVEWRIAPKKQTVWVNMYANRSVVGGGYSSKQEADAGAATSRIACVPLTFTEGEGLE